MPRPPTQPPWEFLLSASRNSLQSYELSRLAHAANLRKEIGALLDQWMEENACALLARWLIEQRERPPRVSELTPARDCSPRTAIPRLVARPFACQARFRIPCPIMFLRIERRHR